MRAPTSRNYHRQQSVSFVIGQQNEEEDRERLMALSPKSQGENQQREEADEEDEDEGPRVNLLGFCVSVPLMECARLVGWLSTVPLVMALILLPFASSTLELLPEIALLGTELVCVLSLFFGLQHHQPAYLRPFLFFGLFWNLALLLLFLFSIMQLLVARREFCAQIVLTLSELVHGAPDHPDPAQFGEEEQLMMMALLGVQRVPDEEQVEDPSASLGLALALCLLALLALTVVVNCWLLNIVLLAYFHMPKMAHQHHFPWQPQQV